MSKPGYQSCSQKSVMWAVPTWTTATACDDIQNQFYCCRTVIYSISHGYQEVVLTTTNLVTSLGTCAECRDVHSTLSY